MDKRKSPRLKEFARLILEGWTNKDAYKKAYKRPDMTDTAAIKAASRLSKNEDFISEVKRLEKKMDKRAVMTRQARMEWLSAQVIAAQAGDSEPPVVANAIRCIAELNKMDGAYEPAKVEVQGDIVKDFVRGQIERASKEPLVKN